MAGIEQRARSRSRERDEGDNTGLPPNFREGDWMCACGNHNYASRNQCFKCHNPRQGGYAGGEMGPAEPARRPQNVPANFRDGDWMCPCGNHNYASKQACNKCKTPRALAGIGPRGGFPPEGFRPGDWVCQCNNHNYASKAVCRCGMPKHALAGGGFMPMAGMPGVGAMGMGAGMGAAGMGAGMGGAAMGGMDPYAAAQAAQQAYAQQMAMGGAAAYGGAATGAAGFSQQPQDMRPGDWICPNDMCAFHNYASKSACHKCKGPKPLHL